MSRLPRCFYVGFQGLGCSHELVFVPRSLLKLLLSAFPLGSLMLGCCLGQSAVRSTFPRQSTHYSIPLWALLHYLDIPVTTLVRIESSRVWWSEPRGPWGLFPAAWVNHCMAGDELVPDSLWRALGSLAGSISLGRLDLRGHLCPQRHGCHQS